MAKIIYYINNKWVDGQIPVNALSFQIIFGFISYSCSHQLLTLQSMTGYSSNISKKYSPAFILQSPKYQTKSNRLTKKLLHKHIVKLYAVTCSTFKIYF